MRIVCSILLLSMCVFLGGSVQIARERSPPVEEVVAAPLKELPYVLPNKYKAVVEQECSQMGVPVWLYCRLIERESKWKPKAVRKNRNGTRDLGLAQLNSRYLADFAWWHNDGKQFDPLDPVQAVKISVRYLARLYGATGDWKMAVLAYNVGLTNVRNGTVPDSGWNHVYAVFYEE